MQGSGGASRGPRRGRQTATPPPKLPPLLARLQIPGPRGKDDFPKQNIRSQQASTPQLPGPSGNCVNTRTFNSPLNCSSSLVGFLVFSAASAKSLGKLMPLSAYVLSLLGSRWDSGVCSGSQCPHPPDCRAVVGETAWEMRPHQAHPRLLSLP